MTRNDVAVCAEFRQSDLTKLALSLVTITAVVCEARFVTSRIWQGH